MNRLNLTEDELDFLNTLLQVEKGNLKSYGNLGKEIDKYLEQLDILIEKIEVKLLKVRNK